MGAKLTLSGSKLKRLNDAQIKKLAQAIIEHNPDSTIEYERTGGRYVNEINPVITFTDKLRISIDLIRQVGANVSLSELSKLAEFYTFVNGVLIISSKEILELK